MMILSGVLVLALNVLNLTEPEKRQPPILLTGDESSSVTAFAQAPNREGRTPPDSASGLTFDEDKPRLDNFAANLKIDPETRAYIIVYGGRVGPPKEALTRGGCIKEYLSEKHGINRERVTVVDGGFRERVTVELFYLSKGRPNPSPVPTVAPRSVRVIKNRGAGKHTCSPKHVKKIV